MRPFLHNWTKLPKTRLLKWAELAVIASLLNQSSHPLYHQGTNPSEILSVTAAPKLIRRYKATQQMETVYMYICNFYIWDNRVFVIGENCLLVIYPEVSISWRSRCKHRKISQLKWEVARVRAATNSQAGASEMGKKVLAPTENWTEISDSQKGTK